MAANTLPSPARSAPLLAGFVLLAAATSSLAGGTQLVRHAGAPLADAYQDRSKLPPEISIDALSAAEVASVKQGILSYLRQNPPGRAEGIDGCMQWLFLRHGPQERWAAVGYSLPLFKLGAVKINGALRRASLNFGITPIVEDLGWFRGTASFPGTAPGQGGISVTTLADRSDFAQWLAQMKNDGEDAMRYFRGQAPKTHWALRLASVSHLVVEAPKVRCTLMAAQCRRYVSRVDDDAKWQPSGASPEVGSLRSSVAPEPIPLAPGLRTEIAIEDMCPFSRQGLVEGPINTRAHPVERGIDAFGIPGNPSLAAALGED